MLTDYVVARGHCNEILTVLSLLHHFLVGSKSLSDSMISYCECLVPTTASDHIRALSHAPLRPV